jgi:hypothetical protein
MLAASCATCPATTKPIPNSTAKPRTTATSTEGAWPSRSQRSARARGASTKASSTASTMGTKSSRPKKSAAITTAPASSAIKPEAGTAAGATGGRRRSAIVVGSSIARLEPGRPGIGGLSPGPTPRGDDRFAAGRRAAGGEPSRRPGA